MLRSSSRLRNSASSSSLASNSNPSSTLSSISNESTPTTLSNTTSANSNSSFSLKSRHSSSSASSSSSSSSSHLSPLKKSSHILERKRKRPPIPSSSGLLDTSPLSTRLRRIQEMKSITTSISKSNTLTHETPSTSKSPRPSISEANDTTDVTPSTKSLHTKSNTRQTRASARVAATAVSDHASISSAPNEIVDSQSTSSISTSLPTHATTNNICYDAKLPDISNRLVSPPTKQSSLGSDFPEKDSKVVSSTQITSHDATWKVGDSVFLRSETKGEPHYLGRIMSFVDDVHVRIAWFYRPQDVLSKKTHYPIRLVVASMHSDINPIRSIVEKCTILHSSEIDDRREDYLKESNTFYYHQLFDRFTKKVYDVIPSSSLTNRPPIVCKLIQRFPFILIEEGKDKEIKQSYKECRICHQYAPKEDSLDCLTCSSVYHSACLSEVKKPKVGYRWQCHFCTVGLPPPPDPSFPVLPSGFFDYQEKPTMFPFTYFGIHCCNLDAFELDIHHPFYPRLASRISPKYQAIIPPFSHNPVSSSTSSSATKSKRQQLISQLPVKFKKQKPSALHSSSNLPFCSLPSSFILSTLNLPSINKSGPSTFSSPPLSLKNMGLPSNLTLEEYMSSTPDRYSDLTLISGIPENSEAEVDRLMAMLNNLSSLPLPSYSTVFLDRVIYEFQRCGHNADSTFKLLSALSLKDFVNGTYSQSEATETALHSLANSYIDQKTFLQFIEAVKEYGFDINLIHKRCLPHLSMQTLVLILYLHKKSQPILDALHNFFTHHDMHFDADVFSLTKIPPNPITTARHQLLSSIKQSMSDNDYKNSKETTLISSPSRNNSTSRLSLHSNESIATIQLPVEEDGEVSVSEHELVEAQQCSFCGKPSSRYILSNLALTTTPTSISTTTTDSKLELEDASLQTTVAGTDTLSHASPSTCFVFCQECGQHWLKYGGFPPKSLWVHGKERKEVLFDEDEDVLSDCSSLGSPTIKPQKKRKLVLQVCELCLQPEELIECVECGIHVHPTCYGVPLVPKRFRCAVCVNLKHPTYSLDSHCLLCPSSVQDTWILTKKQLPLKPTLHFNWVHLLCALFLPMLGFKHFAKLEGVFGIETIPSTMYFRTCSLCMQSQGVTVQCHHAQCPKLFHVSCAFRYGCVFGLQKESTRSTSVDTDPDSEIQKPVIWCRPHGLQATKNENGTSAPVFDFLAFTEPPVISKSLLNLVIQFHANIKHQPSPSQADKAKVCVVKSDTSTKDLKIKLKLQCSLPKLPLHTTYSCKYCGSNVSLYWFTLDEKVNELLEWDYKDLLLSQREAESQYYSKSSTFTDDGQCKLCPGPRKCMVCFAAGK
ncbi:putative PHD type zinc finger protein with BAH domain-containing protein [Coelomomyces lativittatus]|nr:putative PHD type zinc finger protein with BAH domain-containing protein [Coelomomyces lativittatus]KAJ1514541.1 putative PHD type zinc finger protein with BAH domain-containing protein [Coelomomyces lativittatus]KAJ1516265.1 putative PHD type zinc finger protein with BAH domain-containing protein [Coelomomyces lativittatus]